MEKLKKHLEETEVIGRIRHAIGGDQIFRGLRLALAFRSSGSNIQPADLKSIIDKIPIQPMMRDLKSALFVAPVIRGYRDLGDTVLDIHHHFMD